MGEFSLVHWAIILAIVLLIFGPSKLPGLGTSLGKAIRGFKSGLNDADPNDTAGQQARAEQIEAANHNSAKSEALKNGEALKNKEPQNKG